MTKLYHPAVYAQLIALRQKLAEAYESKDDLCVSSLTPQIDRLQLAYWMEGVYQNAS